MERSGTLGFSIVRDPLCKSGRRPLCERTPISGLWHSSAPSELGAFFFLPQGSAALHPELSCFTPWAYNRYLFQRHKKIGGEINLLLFHKTTDSNYSAFYFLAALFFAGEAAFFATFL